MKLNKYGQFEFELDSHINSLNGSSISWRDWNYTTPDNSFLLNVEWIKKMNLMFISLEAFLQELKIIIQHLLKLLKNVQNYLIKMKTILKQFL